MNIDKYLSTTFNTNIITTKTNFGLTNDIYFFMLNNQKYVLNAPKDHLSLLIKNRCFQKVLKEIKPLNIDVKEFYYDPDNQIRITEYIKAQEFKDYHQKDKYIKVIKLLKHLHLQKIKIGTSFNIFEKFQAFKKEIVNELLEYEQFTYLIKDIEALNRDHYLCHNDLVSGNILFDKQRCYIIDWEYACDNDPLFDLMSFITENDIDDTEIRKMIYETYFDQEMSQTTIDLLHKYELIHNLLWACWANMMYDTRKEQIYFDIFENKKNKLLGGLKNEMDIYC